MKRITNLLILFFVLSCANLYSQTELLIAGADAIAESDSIIFTTEVNNSVKKKDVAKKTLFTASDNIYATFYIKQKIKTMINYSYGGEDYVIVNA